jgi:F-type H+-transporting ATPase subunit epsilon
MNGEHLMLQIITPDGQSLKEKQVDAVVVRRREKRFELGSEIALFPRHAPMLIRMPVAPLRYRKGERTLYVAVAGGFMEIKDDQIIVVTPRFERMPADDPLPAASARRRTEQWRSEHREFQKEMVGYL